MAASDLFQSANGDLALLALPAALILLAFGLILLLARNRIRRLWLDIKTRRLVNKLGLAQMANFQCPDGLGHYYSIDRLLMRPDGISLLLFKQFPGSIFCAEHIDEWTQLLGGKSYRFNNPLVDLDHQIKAVSACVPGVEIDGYLFFDHTAVFPKGHPDRVIHLNAVPQSLRLNKNAKAKSAVNEAWEHLLAMKNSS